jgi:short-subunit dehydrogenase
MPSLSETPCNFTALIVTGGSSGIGKSFIELMAQDCPDTLFCNLSRRKPDISSVQLKLRHFACDLADSRAIAAIVSQVEATLAAEAPTGRVLLINNSGFGVYGDFPEPSLGEQLGMIDVNIRAVVELTARLLPLLKARGGAILSVASSAAFQPTPYLATYGATKAFVLNWSMALGEELRGTGVTTLALCPGPTRTEFFHRAGLDLGPVVAKMGQSTEEVVRTALRALQAGHPLVVSGWSNRIGAFLGGLLPRAFVARVAAMGIRRYRRKKGAP